MTDYRIGRWRARPDMPGLYLCTWADDDDAPPCNDPLAYPISPVDLDEWDGDALCLAHLVTIDLDGEEPTS